MTEQEGKEGIRRQEVSVSRRRRRRRGDQEASRRRLQGKEVSRHCTNKSP